MRRVLFQSIYVFLFVFSVIEIVFADSTLVGYWKFDEGTGTIAKDASGYGNHGTLMNLTDSSRVDGVCGKALRFDGTDDYVTVPDANVLDIGTKDFTVMAWVKREAGAQKDQTAIVSKTTLDFNPGYWVGLFQGIPASEIIRQPGGAANWMGIGGSQAAPLNEWHHVAISYVRNGNATFYIDGNAVGDTNISAVQGDLSNTRPLIIGNSEGPPSYFKGTIDEVKIYDRALSGEEIMQAYQSSINIGCLVNFKVTVRAFSPVNLVVTDPVTDSIGLDTTGTRPDTIFNYIEAGSTYDTTLDANNDSENDVIITIPVPYNGPYQIRIVPTDTGQFSLDYQAGNNLRVVLADSVVITTTDTNFTYGLEVLPFLRGDANSDGARNLVDIIRLKNYVFGGGPAPDPLALGDVNCGGIPAVGLVDIVYMVNYVFKFGPAPCS